tara:strand:- start:596 stop:1267 length:672 start_codon:yes stop_codon:yes gene_type:complete
MKTNFNKIIKKLTTNKYVLYVVLFLAITNILGYLMVKDFESIALFIALGVITSYFSKNMIIVLGIAMLGTNFIFANNRIREGFSPGQKEEGSASVEGTKETKKNKKSTKEETKEETKDPMTTLSPASIKEDDDESPGGRIDYASTMEQAYDNLSDMLGKGGIASLSKETKGLLDQQKQLAGQLESMAPLLKDAKGLMDNMNLPNMKELDGMMAKFGGLIGKKK